MNTKQWWERASLGTKTLLVTLLVTVVYIVGHIWGQDTGLGHLGFGLFLPLMVVFGIVALIRRLLKQWWDSAFLTTKVFLVGLLVTVVYIGYIWDHDTKFLALGLFIVGLLLWVTVVLGVVVLIRWLLKQWWDGVFLTTKIFLVALLVTVVYLGLVEVYTTFFLVFPLTEGERGLGLPFFLLSCLTGCLGVVVLFRWLLNATLFYLGRYSGLSAGERFAWGLPLVFLFLVTGLLGVVALIRWLPNAP